MPTQLSKLALVNLSVDGSNDYDALSETKSFSIVQEGAAEASRQVISIEPNVQVIENNREIITSKNYNLTATGVYSQSAKAQLFAWAENRTDLMFTGYGLDGSILQMEGTLQINKGFEDNMSFRFSSLREAKGGYDSTNGKHTAEMSYMKNGLALYGWQEGSTSGIAAGWSKTGGVASFSGDQQTFSTTGQSNVHLVSDDIHFPFPGEVLTFGIYVDTYTDTDSDGSASISIQAYNSSNALIHTWTATVNQTQEFSVTTTDGTHASLPASTEYVKCRVTVNDIESLVFTDPALVLGSTYAISDSVFFNT